MAADTGIKSFWGGLDRKRRLSLGIGVVACIALAALVLFWATRKEYEVLFSQLAEGDAAAIVAQLKRQKIPYALADGGTTIKVPAERVHETRLGLMAGGVPLSGGVGFELFDRQGLGATEQSQRVSYQRALQGELARTIGEIDDVKAARVHLVLPESSLFKRDRREPKAAVTLTLSPGARLSQQQIIGVQRLVAASVEGLESGKVVVSDQRGITLSATDVREEGANPTGARLAMKLEIEEYVTRKVANLLDRTYGPGQAIVSTDVTLNFDEIKRTVEDLLPVAGPEGAAGSVGLKRKREVSNSQFAEPNPAAATDSAEDAAPKSDSTSTEVEYEYGRRVEQVIAAPGGITRMSIGVVIPGRLDAEKQQRITDLVRMAAGIDDRRGDAIVIQPLDQLTAVSNEPTTALAEDSNSSPPVSDRSIPNRASAESWQLSPRMALAMTAGLLLLIGIALRVGYSLKARKMQPGHLSAQERESLLNDVRKTLAEPAAVAPPRVRA